MFQSFDLEPFDIKTIKEFKIDTILDLSDVTDLFCINRDYLRSEEEKHKFDEFIAL